MIIQQKCLKTGLIILSIFLAAFSLDDVTVPNTFVAGTKATSSTVNENFDSLEIGTNRIVDSLERYYAEWSEFADSTIDTAIISYIRDTLEIEDDLYVGDSIYAGDDIEAADDVFIGDDLTVTGSATVTEILTVTDSIYVGDDIGVGDDLFVGDELEVTGTTNLLGDVYVIGLVDLTDSLFVFGNIEANENLYVNDSVYIHDDLEVEDDIKIGGNVSGTGYIRAYGGLNALGGEDGDIFANDDITVIDDADIGGNLIVGDSIVATNNIRSSADIYSGDDLFVADSVYAGGNAVIDGNVGIGITPIVDLHVKGSASGTHVGITTGFTSIGDNTDSFTKSFIANTYNNNGSRFDIRMKGTDSSNAKLTILGSGNVGIGTATPSEVLDVVGNINVSADLYVADSVYVGGNLVVGDSIVATNNIRSSADIYSGDDLFVGDDASITGELSVTDETTLSGGLIIEDKLYTKSCSDVIGSNLIVNTNNCANLIIDTEGSAALDTLVAMSYGGDDALYAGEQVLIRTTSSARDVLVRNGVDNIYCGSDFLLDDTGDIMLLIFDGSSWRCISKQDNN